MLSKLSRYIHPMNCYALAATILTQSLAVAQRSDIIPGIDYMPPGDLEQVQAMVPGAETLDGGIRFRVDAPGKGSYIEKGNRVEAVYTGRLLNGKIFNRKSISYHTYWFTVGAEPRQIIRGWERVMPLMQEGGRYTVAIPAHFAYREKGRRGQVPPHATVVFEIEILTVRR
ncbi:MAG: FKBP-type peptidyl-prolyl cis-trans isomerase [Opitutales bacterium]|nr:FKBP-type peptidyl-prolyl cis-trans isomerase [Opitutales bacterium]NRA28163.1 FKBP-type peptidyl-prolyl cis-trans isomerase [Opitutales bacterium]